eukprot:s4853_g2.t1
MQASASSSQQIQQDTRLHQQLTGLINAGNWSFNDQQVFLLRKQILRAYRELEARTLLEDPEASPPPFKVYVYDEEHVPQLKPLLQSQIYCSRGQWGTDVQLHDFFATSNIQTDDPKEADFFFVPGYAICVLEGNLYSLDEVDELYKELVVALPYFNASGGRDHIFVFGSGMAQTLCKKAFQVFGHRAMAPFALSEQFCWTPERM